MKRNEYIQAPLSLNSQVYQHGGRDHCALTVYMGFSLLEKGALLTEQDAWQAAMLSLAPYADLGLSLDAGLTKPVGEFLAAGRAWTPEQKTATGVSVSLSVGSLRRSFMVMGEQYPAGPLPEPPLPFRSLPLGWAQTAADRDWNPHGIVPGQTPGRQGSALAGPQVTEAPSGREGGTGPDQSPGALAARPNPAAGFSGPGHPLNPEAASPLPLPFGPGRLKNLGLYDRDWLLKAWPGFPDNFNWQFFNAAQKPQRLPAGYFKGDEAVTVTHMHPEHPLLQSSLPGLRARLLVRRADGAEERWLELNPALDTVWLFPESCAGLLIWHASCQTADELASDLAEIVCGLEPLGAPPQAAASLVALARSGWQPLATTMPQEEEEETEAAPEEAAEAAPEAAAPEAAAPEPAPPELPELPKLPAAPLAAAALLSPAAVMAESRRLLAAELPDINKILREQNLPELTLESLEPHLNKQEQHLTQAMDIIKQHEDAERAEASLSEEERMIKSLRESGLKQEEAEGLSKAVSLPVPRESDFASPDEYSRAMDSYGARWASLIGLQPSAGQAHVQNMKMAALAQQGKPEAALSGLMGRLMPPAEAEKMAQSLLHPPQGPLAEQASFVTEMGRHGLDPEAAKTIFTSLKEFETAQAAQPFASFSEKQALLLNLGQGLEKNFNMPAGVMAANYEKNFTLLRQAAYGTDELGEHLEALARRQPELTPHLPELHRLRRLPELKFNSLREIALAAGVSGEGLLRPLAALDILNPGPPPEAAPATAEPLKEESPPPPLEPKPAQPDLWPHIFTSRAEVQAALERGAAPKPENFWRSATLAGLDLSGLDFSGLDLAGADFTESDLSGAGLAGVKGEGCLLGGSRLAGADIKDAAFPGADFTGAAAPGLPFGSAGALERADFSAADLSECNFEGAKAAGADFSGAILPKKFAGAALKEAKFVKGDLRGADFRRAELSGADFTDSALEAASFQEAVCRKTSFIGCDLRRAVWAGARAAGLRIYPGCDLAGADFRQAELDGAGFQGASAAGADFTACRAPLANMSGLLLRGAVFRKAVLREAIFFGADLSGADFTRADLLRASLGSAVLYGATFEGASLYGSDLFRARTDPQSSFRGADLNNTCLCLGDDNPVVGTGGLW